MPGLQLQLHLPPHLLRVDLHFLQTHKYSHTQSHTLTKPGCVTLITRYMSQILCRKEKYPLGFQQQLRNGVDRGFCDSLCSLFFFCALILSVLPCVLFVPVPLHLHLTAVHTLDKKEKVGIRMKTEEEGGGRRKGKRKKEGRGRKKREKEGRRRKKQEVEEGRM